MRLPKGAARRDAVSALVLIAVGAVAILEAADYPDRAAAWPIWMWGLLIAFSVLLLVRSLVGAGGADEG